MAALATDERWFQSRLSRPNANLIVLAGTDFANRIVAVFETAEEAKEAVDAHNARLNKKGPAEAATSPSHGSNTSRQETAVNEQHDTTAPALPAMPDFEKAFFDLEEVIYVVQRRVKAVEFIVDGIDDRGIRGDPRGPVLVRSDERDALHSTARDAAWAIDDLSRRFDAVTAEVVAVESAIRKAGEKGLGASGEAPATAAADPLLELIVDLRVHRSREHFLREDALLDEEGPEVQEACGKVEDLWNRLAFASPPARTAAGARAALNEALHDLGSGAGPLAPSLIRSALAYLGSVHVQ